MFQAVFFLSVYFSSYFFFLKKIKNQNQMELAIEFIKLANQRSKIKSSDKDESNNQNFRIISLDQTKRSFIIKAQCNCNASVSERVNCVKI